jgi:hypothetical protein
LFQSLAQGSGILTHPASFVPVADLQPPPEEAAFQSAPLAIELHLKADHDAGRCLVLPYAVALDAAKRDNLPLHLSPAFIVRKADSPLGRLVVDYTRTGLNHPEKKELLAQHWGPIALPVLADYCETLDRVRRRFPGQRIYCYKTDFDAWYKRIRLAASSAPLAAFPVVIDGAWYIILPLVEQFGSQDSNYHSNFGGSCLYRLQVARTSRLYGIITSHLYSDDTNGFLPEKLAAMELSAIEADANRLAGEGAIKQSKRVLAQRAEVIGWLVDADAFTVSLSYSLFLKLLCVLFIELPLSLQAGDKVTVRQLQRLSSYMIRAAAAIPALLPFSRTAAHNTVGRHHAGHALLESQLIIDIYFWRTTLLLALDDASLLCVSAAVPPLLQARRGEDAAALAARQAAVASLIMHADACTQGGRHGLGYVLSKNTLAGMFAWGATCIPELTSLTYADGSVRPVDINVLEFVAAVLAASAAVHHGQSPPTDDRPPLGASRPTLPLTHIHLWTDNTSCLSWMLTYRASHPLHSFLLQVLSHMQSLTSCLLTFGHVAGAINVYADAASRDFQCPNGPQLRRTLSSLKVVPPTSDSFKQHLLRIASEPSRDTWQLARDALTAAEQLLCRTSPPPTASPRTFL